MFKNIDFKIDVKIGPVQMITVQQLNVLDSLQRLVFKIRITLIAEEIFLIAGKKPDAVRCDVFNTGRNVFARP